MKLFNCIHKLLSRKKKIVVITPNKYADSVGMKVGWTFDLDRDGLPIFHSASQKVKWEMAHGEYSFMFDKYITEV